MESTDWDAIRSDLRSVLEKPYEKEAMLFRVCEVLRERVPRFDWVGFYLADAAKRELILGPYAGEPTDHVRIPYGRGICGQAAERLATFVVPDVTKETNYLSCSAKVKSEIVLPVLKDGVFVAELDIDSHTPNAFSEEDRKALEWICGEVARLF